MGPLGILTDLEWHFLELLTEGLVFEAVGGIGTARSLVGQDRGFVMPAVFVQCGRVPALDSLCLFSRVLQFSLDFCAVLCHLPASHDIGHCLDLSF